MDFKIDFHNRYTFDHHSCFLFIWLLIKICFHKLNQQGKSETAKGLLWAFSTLDNKYSCNTHIATILKVLSKPFLSLQIIFNQALARTSLPCLLEDIRNMGLLNKILEARYDDNQVLINSKGDYKPVAELFVTTNKVVFIHCYCQMIIIFKTRLTPKLWTRDILTDSWLSPGPPWRSPTPTRCRRRPTSTLPLSARMPGPPNIPLGKWGTISGG